MPEPTTPAPDDAPSSRVDLTAAPSPGLVRVAGPAAGDTGFLVLAGDDESGVCVDGVCALPPAPAQGQGQGQGHAGA